MAALSTEQQIDEAFFEDNKVHWAWMNQLGSMAMTGAFISLYPVDFFLDNLVVPLRTLLMIRTGIVLWRAAIAAISFLPAVKRQPAAFAVFFYVSAALDILTLTALTGGALSPYDGALMGTTFFVSILFPWRMGYFAPAAVFCCCILYPFVLWVSGTLGSPTIWVSHLAVLSVTAGVSVMASFFFEKLRRAAFVTRIELDKKTQDLDKKTQDLDKKTQDLESALSTIQEQQRHVSDDLRQARNFQNKLLRLLPSSVEIEFAAMYNPADFLGGDFYDVSCMGPDWYRLFIADVTGHGTQAAMCTMILQQQLERANKACDTPWGLLAAINDGVVQAFGSMVVNYCALCIDFKKNDGAWAMTGTNAGLPEPALYQRQGAALLTDVGTYQGILEAVDYPRFERQLMPGDGMALATDGVVDLLDDERNTIWIPDQALFTSVLAQSATSALARVRECLPPPKFNDRSDDLTMIVVRIPGALQS